MFPFMINSPTDLHPEQPLDHELRIHVPQARSWGDLFRRVAGGSMLGSNKKKEIRARIEALSLDTSHFFGQAGTPTPEQALGWSTPLAAPERLREAGLSIAMAWFLLRGHKPSIPIEPEPYDLLVKLGGTWKQVQVKTSTARGYGEDWQVVVSKSPTESRGRLPYSADDVDLFFVIDGDMSIYLIPASMVRGKQVIVLGGSYQRLRVGSAASLMA